MSGMIGKNDKILAKKGKKYNFLFDTSTILYFEKMWKVCGASIFKVMNELPEVNFFVCNNVLSELVGGSKGFSPPQLNTFLGHVLNAESSMDHKRKENRFLIDDGGKVKYVVLNKISSTDYAQILLCQNHPELILVANDRRLIKSGAQVISGRRVIGIPAFLKNLLKKYPDNKRLISLKEAGDKIFVKKHAFGERDDSKRSK